MATHLDDEAELETLKTWWKDNWLALAGGLVLGLGAIFSWEGWKHYQTQQSLQASQIYEDMKSAFAASKRDEATGLGERLIQEFAATPYAANAALRLASADLEQQKPDTAAARLQWVIQHSKDEGLVQLARLRQARVLWQQEKPDEALKLLDQQSDSYAPLYEELRGDIKLVQGDRAAARAAYDKALQALPEGAANREVLQQKIDDLADVAVAS